MCAALRPLIPTGSQPPIPHERDCFKYSIQVWGIDNTSSDACAKRVIETIIKPPTAHCNTLFTLRGSEKPGQHVIKRVLLFSDWCVAYRYTHALHTPPTKRSLLIETSCSKLLLNVAWTNSLKCHGREGLRMRAPPLCFICCITHFAKQKMESRTCQRPVLACQIYGTLDNVTVLLYVCIVNSFMGRIMSLRCSPVSMPTCTWCVYYSA